MTYIDYLNKFNQWLETNPLPASSQLMYFKLLNVFNRAGWPKEVGVDNLRFQMMLDGAAKTTVVRARDKLVETGFITYKKGRKGFPNRYALMEKVFSNNTENDTEIQMGSIYATENATLSATENATLSATENATHIKTKTKKKTKTYLVESYDSTCAEPETVSAPPAILLPLNDGTGYPVSQEQCQEWAGLYPAVDVIQQLRNMKGWLDSNPSRRKTKRGINRFITSWLAKEQDRGGQRKPQGGARTSGGNIFMDMLREEKGCE